MIKQSVCSKSEASRDGLLIMDEKNQIGAHFLSELGLEDLDGVLFFCSESYPDLIQNLYRDTFKSVFQSVPVFLIARDNRLYHVFKESGLNVKYEDVELMVYLLQTMKKRYYSDRQTYLFRNTMDLLKKVQITDGNEFDSDHKFQFLFPSGVPSKSAPVSEGEDTSAVIQKEEPEFYQTVAVVSCMRMITMIRDLQEELKAAS